jgi:phage virion morphogenesis protein
MRSIGQTLVAATDLAFRSQKDPWGQAWKPLAASTLRGRRKGKGSGSDKILRDTGRLSNSITYRAERASVQVGTNVIYAAIHQFGGSIDVAARNATVYFRQNKRTGEEGNRFVRKSKSNFAQDVTIGAHKITIPARPFLPVRAGGDLPADTRDDVLDILRRYLRSPQ